MKTTIEIAGPLIAEARRAAARDDTTLRALVEEGLRRVLAERQTSKRPFRLKDASVPGKGIRVGLREGDWTALIYEGRGT